MSEPTLFHVFTPQRDQPEELEKILVKRHALLESAVGKIRESVISPDKHRLLLIGPRGMGKSYLTTLIHHRLSLQKDLAGKMRFAWLNEDQTSTTFLHLLLRIYRKLADQYPAEFSAGELDAIRGKEPADAREIIGQALIRQLHDRTVVLIIENLDSIFNAMNEVEQRTWRGFIQDHPRFAIVATAQGLTSAISSKAKPFYGFFDINHLEPLTVDEAAELLEKIATLNKDQPLAEFIASTRGKARMRAIHHLSGGNPRLYLILSDFLTKDSLDNLVRLFEETVDRQLTPYFQERMRWLSPQQQEIVQYLCQQVHPASVKAISEGIFTKQNTVSGQLKQLREKGYLVSKGRGKESLYELAEPLMRLSFQLKEMNNRQPLTLIVDFMRVWYDRPDLEKRLEGILPGTFGRDYFELALQKIDTEGNEFRHSLMLACLDDINWKKCSASELEDLRGIAEETKNPGAWSKYGWACFASNKFPESVEAMTQVIVLQNNSSFEQDGALLCRAACHQMLGHHEDALIDFSLALESPDITKYYSTSIYYLRGQARYSNGLYAEAVIDLNQVVKDEKIKPHMVSEALVLRGKCQIGLCSHKEALADLDAAIEIPEIPEDILSEALTKRAYLYSELEQDDKAIADSNRVEKMREVRPPLLAQALFARVKCSIRSGNIDGAKNDLDVICCMSNIPKYILAGAHLCRGNYFRRNGKLESALADLSKATDSDDAISAHALFGLSEVYRDLRLYEQSIESVILFLSQTKTPDIPKEFLESSLGEVVTDAAYGMRERSEKWISALKKMLPLLEGKGFIFGLSVILVFHARKLQQSDLNHAALDSWVSDWESVSEGYPEMQIGVRMLRAGVEWIKTKNDGALLDLVMEERAVVRQALGLEEEE